MKLYPTDLAPWKFSRLAIKHKMPVNGTVEDLPL